MAEKKPWTVMVYIAADNNLTNYGVTSLKQMKAAGGDSVNVIAEFNTGPLRTNKRYLFDGGTLFGSIKQDQIGKFGPTDAGDPENLAAFINWSTEHFPADHYFVIIDGHGGGVDDAFPGLPNRPFLRRHALLNVAKGVLDSPPKGVLDSPPKGVLGLAQQFMAKNVQDAAVRALHRLVVGLLATGIRRALDERVLTAVVDAHSPKEENGKNKSALQKKSPRLPAAELARLTSTIVGCLESELSAQLVSGDIGVLQQRIINAINLGVFTALQNGSLLHVQETLLKALHESEHASFEREICSLLNSRLLHIVAGEILDALQQALSDMVPTDTPPATKSVAFVDHPASFLTNAGLKKALGSAHEKLGRKIDILGMDACNMGMIEIGYEVREHVRFLVASEDDVPLASWPYDEIVSQLVHSPDLLPRDLACLTTRTYVSAYRDYIDQPVSLSVLDLTLSPGHPGHGGKVLDLFTQLTKKLVLALRSPKKRQMIGAAREQAKSFGRDEFVDLIQFCEQLAVAPGDPTISEIAAKFIAAFRPVIVNNSISASNCGGAGRSGGFGTGASIYFPGVDPQDFDHLRVLGQIYRKLEFSKKTGWGKFIAEFLHQQQAETAAADAIREINLKSPRAAEGRQRDAFSRRGMQGAAKKNPRATASNTKRKGHRYLQYINGRERPQIGHH